MRAAARQVLTRGEFFDQMEDHRVDKYVAWEKRTSPIGMITLTRHLESVPWISPEYFAARYPEQWARNAIYYLGFTLAHPRNRDDPASWTRSSDVCVEPLVAGEGGDCVRRVFYNNDVLRVSPANRRCRSGGTPTSEPEELDSQIYYGVNFG